MEPWQIAILAAGGVALIFIVWLAATYGVWAGVAILAVFVSMFRRPLIYFAKRAMGRVPPPSGDDRA